jgi:hypothetical protein
VSEVKREVWVTEQDGVPVGAALRRESIHESYRDQYVRYVPAASDQAGKAEALPSRSPECAAPNCGLSTDTAEAFRVIRDCEPADYCSVECAVSDAREIGRLEGIAESGKAQVEWVAVSERLPEEGALVLVYETGWTEPAIGHHVGGVWLAEDDDDDQLAVTHWMPLPPPPSSSTPGSSDG